MSTTMIARIVGRVLCYSHFKCMACGKEARGTGFEVSIDTHDLDMVANLANIQPAPHNMPVNWAHFGGGKYRCSTCLEK